MSKVTVSVVAVGSVYCQNLSTGLLYGCSDSSFVQSVTITASLITVIVQEAAASMVPSVFCTGVLSEARTAVALTVIGACAVRFSALTVHVPVTVPAVSSLAVSSKSTISTAVLSEVSQTMERPDVSVEVMVAVMTAVSRDSSSYWL